jgi:sec-independent protein translocase protein TatB
VFDLSPEKVLLVGLIALIVLGPNRLPQAARTLGRFVGQLRTMSASFQSEVRDAIGEPSDALGATVAGLRPGEIRKSVRDAVTSTLAPPPTPAPQVTPSPSLRSNGSNGSVSPTAPDDPSLN